MDNQQETLIVNNNYFAGLIDSDFGVYISECRYKGKTQLQPRIKFVNTRPCLVECCSCKLHEFGINHYVETNKPTVGKTNKSIIIQRFSKCISFADNFSSLCVVRRPQLEIIKEFCGDRLYYVKDCGWKHKNTPYSDKQKDLYKRLCRLNLNYNYDSGYRNYTNSWLAGMIDGDGSIYFCNTSRKCKYKQKNGVVKEYVYRKILPVIKVTTESDSARNNIKEIYNEAGIRYYEDIYKSKASKKLGKGKKKYYYSIFVKEFDDLLLVINKLEGNLVAKERQLAIMKEYIELKKSDRSNSDYTMSLAKKVKKLNNGY